ncbi:interleukin-10 receptor subunit alpha [Nerophis ophidion]|uniref:interleukin-10 receptor subunit alpha n=1 Tax=Nerophis ophidion TaxID=159077 RepID=UPI002AE047B8|nr:interleukin-10 receptor subunit alpha [Nerophis ophidion]
MPVCKLIMMSHKTLIIAFMLFSIGSGQDLKLSVNIVDGEVVVLWNKPRNATSDIKYNVQMGKYSGTWDKVGGCTGVTKTYCDLSGLIQDYRHAYKVRVQTVDKNITSEWTKKKFLPNENDLQPPSFTLYATSSTITVHVHQKPVLKKLFPYGVTYVVYLEEKGQDDKKTISYLTDYSDQGSKTFTSLHWGVEYCISIKVEGNGALSRSNLSPEQCLQLPEHVWFITAVASLTTLGVLASVSVAAIGLLCHLNRPVKTPSALKCTARDWRPLSVRESSMEVVIDKGWFLSGRRTEVENPVTLHVLEYEDQTDQDRRTSLDSGLSMGSTEGLRRQEDSGCESMAGTECSRESGIVYPKLDNTDKRKEDSEVGLRYKLESSTLNNVGTLGNYQTQCPGLRNHVRDEESIQILPGVVLAETISGYKAGTQSCICSGPAQCIWCLQRMVQEAETMRQHKDNFIIDVARRNKIATNDLETVEAFPFLTALTGELSPSMDCNVQLDTD